MEKSWKRRIVLLGPTVGPIIHPNKTEYHPRLTSRATVTIPVLIHIRNMRHLAYIGYVTIHQNERTDG